MSGKPKSQRRPLDWAGVVDWLCGAWYLQVRVRWRARRSGYTVKIQRVLDAAELAIARRRHTAPPGMILRLEHLLVEAHRLRDDPDKVTKMRLVLVEIRDALAAALQPDPEQPE